MHPELFMYILLQDFKLNRGSNSEYKNVLQCTKSLIDMPIVRCCVIYGLKVNKLTLIFIPSMFQT